MSTQHHQSQHEHSPSNLFLVRLFVQQDGEGREERYIKVQHVLGNQTSYLHGDGCQELVSVLLSLVNGAEAQAGGEQGGENDI